MSYHKDKIGRTIVYIRGRRVHKISLAKWHKLFY